MKIVIASIFRNSSTYLQRYFKQISLLTVALGERGHSVHTLMVEGDSSDDTYEGIQEIIEDRPGFTLLKCDHGGPVFGSIDNDQRWRNISKVCNYLLTYLPRNDITIYVESDLIWTTETMLALIDDLETYDAVAPMCFHLPTGLFYDTWGHRRNGVRFSQHPPYHHDLSQPAPDERLEIDSAGSCIVMREEIASLARFLPPELGIVGFCNDIRQWGFKLYLNPHQRVLHP